MYGSSSYSPQCLVQESKSLVQESKSLSQQQQRSLTLELRLSNTEEARIGRMGLFDATHRTMQAEFFPVISFSNEMNKVSWSNNMPRDHNIDNKSKA